MSVDDTQAPQSQDPVATDTSALEDQSEASTQTNEAPEATQTVEEKQTEEVNATDTADKLYAGKYKTPEDMEKAYKELESKFGRETSEKADLTRILNEAFTPPEAPQAQVEDDYEESNPLTEKVERMERQSAVQGFIFTHPDANGSAMNEVLGKDPIIQQIQGHEAKLEYAYLKSQNMSSAKAIAEAQKTAANQAQTKIVEKQAAQVETARKADTTDENSELMERATGNYSQEDRDNARKALIRKNLINL